jgi:hypothetical protein
MQEATVIASEAKQSNRKALRPTNGLPPHFASRNDDHAIRLERFVRRRGAEL